MRSFSAPTWSRTKPAGTSRVNPKSPRMPRPAARRPPKAQTQNELASIHLHSERHRGSLLMQITQHPAADSLEMRLTGRIDATWAEHLSKNIETAVRAGCHQVVLNFAGVDYISSLG